MHKRLVSCSVYKSFTHWNFGTNKNYFGNIITQREIQSENSKLCKLGDLRTQEKWRLTSRANFGISITNTRASGGNQFKHAQVNGLLARSSPWRTEDRGRLESSIRTIHHLPPVILNNHPVALKPLQFSLILRESLLDFLHAEIARVGLASKTSSGQNKWEANSERAWATAKMRNNTSTDGLDQLN